MFEVMRTRLLPYAVAILSVAIALLLMLMLDPWLHMTQTPFLLFFGAAIVSAWLGGKKAGAIATILSGLLANYFFLDPIGQLSLDATDIWRTLLFVLEGILISAICGGLRAAEHSTKISLQRLQISEAKFRRLVESNIIGVISADTHGVITDANDCFLNMVGYTREDLLAGRVRWDEMTPPELRHLDALALDELMTTGAHSPYEKAYITKDGRRVPILVGAVLLEDESHNHVIAFILDLTERKRTEAALRESQQLFSNFMSNSPVKAYIKDEAGRYVYVSPLVEREHNRPLADWVGKTDFDFFTAEIAQQLRDNDAIVLQTNHTLQILETVPADNEEYNVMSFKFPFQDAEGRNLVAGMSIDITAQIRVEKALRESEALVRAQARELQAFMEIVPAAVWIAHDPNCHQMTANCAAYELMRAKPDSVTTATPADGVYPFNFKLQRKGRDIPPGELSMQKAGSTGQEVEEDAELVFEDGVVRYIYGKAVPLRDEEGGVRGVIGAYLDITDRKQAEEALRETAERLSLALTAARMGDWSWDAATDTVTFSHRAAEIFGIPPGPYMTWTQMRELLHPEDRDRAKVAVEEAIASGGD
ncbi:PAS domain S-box protein, partial [Planktothrix sp. FACHB-1355]|nr:PAS domain S-box protein [Planktothrix sp. FACHB-1355]